MKTSGSRIGRGLHLAAWALALFTVVAPARGGLFDSYPYAVKLTFPGYTQSETLTNFPVLVTLSTNISGFSYGQFQSTNALGDTNADLRFSDASGNTELHYEVDTWDTSSNSLVWVRVPLLSNSTDVAIYAYWGKTGIAEQAYTTNGATWTNGYVGVWHLKEDATGTGSKIYRDSSTNYNYGTDVVSTASSKVGQIGAGQRFTWANKDYIGMPDIPALSFGDGASSDRPFSASAWVRMVASTTTNRIISKAVGTTSGQCEWTFTLSGATNLQLELNDDTFSGPTRTRATSSNEFSADAGTWTHYAATYDGQRDPTGIKLYRNGELLASAYTTGSTYAAMHDTAASLQIGHAYWGGTSVRSWANANMDEVELSAGVRSASWIWASYSNQISGSTFVSNDVVVYRVPVIANNGPTSLSTNSVRMVGDLTSTGGAPTEVYAFWGTNNALENKSLWQTNLNLGTKDVGLLTNEVSSLPPGTLHYFRFYASNTLGGASWSAVSNFTTYGAIVDNYTGATDIAWSSATLQGRVLGGNPTPDVFVCWGTNYGGATTDSWEHVISMGPLPAGTLFSTNIVGLDQTTTYYYRCLATNSYMEAWAPDYTNFITPLGSVPVEVDNDSGADNISYTSATLRGQVLNGTPTPDVYVCWGDTPGGVTTGSWQHVISMGPQSGAFSTNLAGLNDNQEYFYTCYATNANNSEDWAPDYTNFTTWTLVPVEVDNDSGADVTGSTTATLRGEVLNGTPTPDVYVCWGETPGGATTGSWDHVIAVGPQSGTFSTNLAGLEPGQTYYYTCYAANGYSDDWAPSYTSFTPPLPFESWQYRVKIACSGYTPSETLTNFPLVVNLGTSITGFAYEQFLSTNDAGDVNADLRFSDSTGKTELKYEVESWSNASGNSAIWVQVPALAASTDFIYAYWGMTNVTAPVYTTNGTAWANGHLGVWHLKETSGTFKDSTTRFNGSDNVGSTDKGGVIDGGQDFNGNGDYISIADDNALSFGNTVTDFPFSVSAWIKADMVASNFTIISKANGTATLVKPLEWAFSAASNGNLSLNLYNSGTTGPLKLYLTATNGPAPQGVWNYVCATFDSTRDTNGIALYANGVRCLEVSGALGGSYIAMSNGSSTVDIGVWERINNTYRGYSDGHMDEVRLDNVVRSPGWIWASYSNQVSGSEFLTYGRANLQGAPYIENVAAQDVLTNSASLVGNLVSTGAGLTEVTLYWGTNNAGELKTAWSNNAPLGSPAVGYITNGVSSLLPGTLYYYRFYATNTLGGEDWPPVSNFTTYGAIVDNYTGATDIAVSSATLQGRVITGNPTPDVFVCWGTNIGTEATGSWDHVESLGPLAAGTLFSTNIVGLDESTTYYYRCLATNAYMDAWAASYDTFSTISASIPAEVDNDSGATDINYTSATLQGRVLNGTPPVDVYVCWGTNAGNLITTGSWDHVESLGPQSGAFSTNIGGLLQNQTYYYACFATNATSEDWAPDYTNFNTWAAVPVEVDNDSGATSITHESATLRGEVLGGGPVPNVFVCWGTNAGDLSTTGSWEHVESLGPQSGTFSTNIGGLLASQVYYYACYATNAFDDDWAPAYTNFTTDPQPGPFASWQYRMKIACSGYTPSETLTNFPLLVRLGTNIAGFSYAQFLSTNAGIANADLRFSDASGMTELKYEVENWSISTNSAVWVQVPELTASTDFIYAYWGMTNVTAPTYITDGTAWASDHLGVWHLKETSGNFLDSTTNGFSGADNVVNTGKDGVIDGGQDFNGSSDYVGIGDKLALTFGNSVTDFPFSVSAWIRRDAALGFPVITKANNTSTTLTPQPEWRVLTSAAGALGLYLSDNSTGAADSLRGISADGVVPVGEWCYVCTTYNSTMDTNGIVLYCDGLPIGLVAGGKGASYGGMNDTPSTVDIGAALRSSASNKSFADGLIDEVRVDRVVRSPGWVWASYSNQVSGSEFLTYGRANLQVAPSIENVDAQGLTTVNASLVGRLLSTGGGATEVTVYWGTNNAYESKSLWMSNAPLGEKSAGYITNHVTALLPNTLYYYRFYATNDLGGEDWATVSNFTTYGSVTVDNDSGATNIGPTWATLRGNVTGGSPAPLVYICWGTNFTMTESTGAWEHVESMDVQSGTFSTNLTNLDYGVPHYYRCYATNAYGDGWADTYTNFIPTNIAVEVDNDGGATNVRPTSAELRGQVIAGVPSPLVYVCWGASYSLVDSTGSWQHVESLGTNASAFSAIVSNLAANQTYYYRCYGTNAYGDDWAPTYASFTTPLAVHVWKGGTGDWSDETQWSNGVPVAGSFVTITNGSVLLTNASAVLASLTMSGGTLTFSNLEACVHATNVTIAGGTVRHAANTDTSVAGGWTVDGRIYFACTNSFLLQSPGLIDANGRGWQVNSGPGAPTAAGGGGGYGGYGGNYIDGGGRIYGNAAKPDQPGSGAASGTGGGLVWIEAPGGTVVVNGTIRANASTAVVDEPGSGGGIWISCGTFAATNGVLQAKGGSSDLTYGARSYGGGGRIAVDYASVSYPVSIAMEASRGTNGNYEADIGTIHLPDTRLLGETLNYIEGEILGPTSWGPTNLTIGNKWVRFGEDGFTLAVSNNLTIDGTAGRLELGGSGANILANKWWANRNDALMLLIQYSKATQTLTCGGNLTLSNGGDLRIFSGPTNAPSGYGALVDVTGNVSLDPGSWIYPVSNPTNGGSPLFKMHNLTIPALAGFDATQYGYAGGGGSRQSGYGPGAGGEQAGGGYGGAGGNGGGGVYGVARAPLDPGSGGGRQINTTTYAASGGSGGGLIRLQVADMLSLNGTLKSDGRVGSASTGAKGGAGSGGGINLKCATLTGTGTFVADGGTNALNQAGSGGGGRIAIWCTSSHTGFSGTTSANPGATAGGVLYLGATGTVVWIEPQSIFTFR